MSQTLRQPEIMAIARRDRRVTVDGLAAHFGVTLQTIRRDLTELAEAGQLERVHGGAVLPSGTANIAYAERQALNAPAKARIGAATAAMIPDDSAVFLGIGTTTEAVAAALGPRHGLLVVTNNLHVAQILAPHPSARVIVAGGTLRAADGGIVGPLAAELVQRFRFDVAVTGCSAMDEAGHVLDFDLAEVAVTRAVLAQARRRILTADLSKLRRTAPVLVAGPGGFDHWVTDAAPPAPVATACGAAGTAVVVA